MALIVIPSLLSKRPWARIQARCEASFFIVLSKSSRCCSVRGHTYLTLIHLGIGFTYRIVLKLSRGILYQKTFGRALIAAITQESVITRILRHCKLASVPHLLLPLPVLATQRLIGWPKPTTSRVASEARCAQRRCLSPLCACRISLGHAGAGGASRTIGAESMTFALAPDIQ